MNGPTPPSVPPPDRDRLAEQRLPCGVDADDLLEQVAEGRADQRDEHQVTCLHCQAALTEFAALWAPVQEAARRPVELPAGLVANVMRRVELLTKDLWYTVQLGDNGVIRVATRVVAALARVAALRVPGVRVALGRSSEAAVAKTAEASTRRHRHPHSAVGVLGGTAVVDLALTVTYGQPIETVARQVQNRVAQELRDTVGLQQVTVNVTVDDVVPPRGVEER